MRIYSAGLNDGGYSILSISIKLNKKKEAGQFLLQINPSAFLCLYVNNDLTLIVNTFITYKYR
ncbi:hypothetical protein D3C72_973820 [compost metagenome]